ncbi:MAG: hypothetical protein K5656_03645 [Lachnospiraceae bacterium]|nr:hypothetical protein [Lachnospiraceae bacterium]
MSKKNIAAAAVVTGVAAVGTATAAIIAKQRKKKAAGEELLAVDLDQRFTDFKNKLEELKITVDNATADSREDLKITIGNLKGDAVHYAEEFRRKAERSKSKMSSELLRAQMNFEVKMEELEEDIENRKYESEKKKDENRAIKMAENAEILMDYALEMVQQATVASLEAADLANDYEEKYGESLDMNVGIEDIEDDIEDISAFDEDDIEE